MPPDDDIRLPPRYRDVRLLARGGMGEVFRATDDELGRDVAVKVLAERYAGDDSLRARFRREALAAARLSSDPSIVTIYDVAELDGRPAIVMEYLPGGSLEERVAGRAPCPAAQVLDWLAEAAAALDAAHAAGVVHRDVKPGNLLLDAGGHVHVADFGVASAAGLDSFTSPGTVLGTAGYLSPEQARGERATAASDRYSLAGVAWELLTGRRPFESDSPTAEAAAHAHARPPSTGDAALDRVFQRALAKDPAARPPTATAFVDDLRRALRAGSSEATTWLEAPPPARRRGRGPLVAALVLLLVAAGAVAAVLVSRDRSSSGPPRPVTVVHTVTEPGTTVAQTVVTAEPPPTTAPTSTETGGASSGAALNDAGFRKLQAGDAAGARPLLEQAVAKLQGTGSTTEAYADYNLAFARFALGDCDGVAGLLDASERIQGHRKEIDRLRHDVGKRCG